MSGLVRVQPPSAPLRTHVEYLWYHEGLVCDYTMERLLPDGAIELIVDLTDSAKRWSEADNLARVHTVRRSWISGQHSRPIAIEAAQNSGMNGARFLPGGAWAIVREPVSELNDSVVEIELLWGAEIHELREQLLAAPSIDARFALLDAALVRRTTLEPDADRCVARAVDRIARAPAGMSIRDLAAEIGISQGRLVRLFEQRVGLRPKMLARVLRFQRVLRRLERDPRLSWSALAAEYGYFDQSHFIKDFAALSGLRPTQYLQDRGEYFNFLPIRPTSMGSESAD
jgi:AraC-like DNA-binding protein